MDRVAVVMWCDKLPRPRGSVHQQPCDDPRDGAQANRGSCDRDPLRRPPWQEPEPTEGLLLPLGRRMAPA